MGGSSRQSSWKYDSRGNRRRVEYHYGRRHYVHTLITYKLNGEGMLVGDGMIWKGRSGTCK